MGTANWTRPIFTHSMVSHSHGPYPGTKHVQVDHVTISRYPPITSSQVPQLLVDRMYTFFNGRLTLDVLASFHIDGSDGTRLEPSSSSALYTSNPMDRF